MKKTIDELNSIKFSGLQEFNLGEAMPMMAANIKFNNKMSIKNKLHDIFHMVFFENVDYKLNTTDSKILCIYSDERIVRKDYKRIFDNICNCQKPICNKLVVNKKIKRNLRNWKHSLKLLKKVCVWMIQLGRTSLRFSNKLRIMTEILRIYATVEYLSEMENKASTVIVFCDIFATDNICVQFFKNRHVITMTLQHAAFTAPLVNAKNINDLGIELTYSNSDYFLGWNQFTKEQAQKAGMREGKFKIVGLPQFADFNNTHKGVNGELKRDSEVFGVVLGVMEYDQINRQTILLANQISKLLNMKYVLKYHPNFSGMEYSNLVNENYVENVPREISLSDYTNLVNFSLLSITSMFIELIFLHHPIYRLSVNDTEDKFHQISEFRVSNLEEFKASYQVEQQGLFEYLCTTDKVKESYNNCISNVKEIGEKHEN